jgi:hypothetical protein
VVTGDEKAMTRPAPRPVRPFVSTAPLAAWPIRISRIGFVARLDPGAAENVA